MVINMLNIKDLEKLNLGSVRSKANRLALLLPDYNKEIEQFSDIAQAGFTLVLNCDFGGPEHFMSTFSPEWQQLYSNKGYSRLDPVTIWAITHSGQRRWSEINIPDVSQLFKKARAFGLNYGAVFSRRVGGFLHALSVSRSDRELTDEEITTLSAQMDRITQNLSIKPNLKEDEVAVLRLLSHGTSYSAIAFDIGVSEPTVKNRIRDIKNKLGATTTANAVAIGFVKGLI